MKIKIYQKVKIDRAENLSNMMLMPSDKNGLLFSNKSMLCFVRATNRPTF